MKREKSCREWKHLLDKRKKSVYNKILCGMDRDSSVQMPAEYSKKEEEYANL